MTGSQIVVDGRVQVAAPPAGPGGLFVLVRDAGLIGVQLRKIRQGGATSSAR